MKIVFLDFDGVLNTIDWVEMCKKKDRAPHEYILAVMLDRVNNLVDETGSKVVATTNWRMEYSHQELDRVLTAAGASFSLYSTTPVLHKPRGLEVLAWLDGCGEEVDAFVILDDLPREDFDEFGRTNLITTDSRIGLTNVGAARASRLLKLPDRGFRRDSLNHDTLLLARGR